MNAPVSSSAFDDRPAALVGYELHSLRMAIADVRRLLASPLCRDVLMDERNEVVGLWMDLAAVVRELRPQPERRS